MKIIYILIAIILAWSAIWAIGSYLVIAQLESPRYTVLEKRDWYEIRQYEPYLVAEVEVFWDQNQALNSGFRYLAEYIFWGNTKSEKIAMTTPVADIQNSTEKIAMTTPVNDIKTSEQSHIIQFSLPRKYTLKTLPTPNSERVELKEIEWYKAAALTYRLWASETKVENKKQLLRGYLKRDGVTVEWSLKSAQYNPPASFPLTRRNKIIAKIK